ncbi:thiaminase II [Dellaglioa carnosa]|uniref:thiaminase II n=1 Tax=Dellaglioa carnosa TaxID=2995136 RepID=UPI0022A82A0E|nr:thiaminase II [Dellaglioa carnosa]MCZ2492750.1 thiaminase II [Dellaglioa carnosa]
MLFSEKVRRESNDWWERSFEHPFIKQLVDGSLPAETFRYYLIQDHYYLKHFSKIHQLVGEQSDDAEIKKLMFASAEGLAQSESAIRDDFFKELNITDEEIEQTGIAPTAYHYVSHMYRQLAEFNPEAAFSGLLPCAWLYLEIGYKLIGEGSPNPMYQRWIETYSTDEFKESVDNQRRSLDRVAKESSQETVEAMANAFKISSIEEYNFWGMALDHQTWE